MHFSTAFAAVAAVAPLIAAHGENPIPNIVGLKVRDLKTRDMFSNLRARIAAVNQEAAEETREHKLNRRQGGTDGQCGAGFANCAAGYCCSEGGYCGTGPDYCYSPGCQYKYGPACPENITPAGTNTSTIARTKLGSVEYGGNGIYECVTPGTVALTYDDGPQADFTAHILDIFASYNAKATFFITGNNINKGEIDTTPEYVSDIKRMYAEGHQVASHTWTHLDLSAISHADRVNQMYKNEMAIRNILGVIPTYMRPPYSSCTGQCETDMASLGYHVTYFNVDTDDYNQDSPNKIQNSKNWFRGNVTQGGATAANNEWLAIAHDIHQQTAYNLTDYMLSTLTTLGYKAVTVGECLGDPEANWYRSASGAGTPVTTTSSTATKTSSTAAPTGTKKVSSDATCGGTNGYTCAGSTFGNCCSANGWCGSTTDYCGTGCQSAFGSCTGSASSSSVKPATSSVKTSSTKPATSSVKTSSTKAATSSVKPSSTTKAATSTVKTSTAPSATLKVSTDATCGGTNKYTCKGSTFGNCCSVNGWCGSTAAYCGTGCQTGFGTCT